MMRQALVALGPKTVLPLVLVGGAAIALGALLLPHEATGPAMYRLTLHAPAEPGNFYLSAWSGGDVFVGHDAGDRRPLTFTRRGDEHDGCSWMGTEQLVPIGPRAYQYSYGETILSCRPGAVPFRKTPRTGIVTVEKYGGVAMPTAFSGVQPAAELWNGVDDDCDAEEVADDLADAQRDLDDELRELKNATRALDDARQAMRDAEDLADSSADVDDE